MRSYEVPPPGARHHVDDVSVCAVALSTVLSVWGGIGPACAVAVGALLARRPVLVAAMCVATGVAGTALAHHAWASAVPRHLGPYRGWAQVMGDPQPSGAAVRVTLQLQRERFDAWLYGHLSARVATASGGEWVWIEGVRSPLTSAPHRAQVRHVVGRVVLRVWGDRLPGSALARAANRVRSALRSAAERTMPADDASLFTGLVLGDDAREPPALLGAFRSSGLSHLTAVSGQNVSYVLAAAAPLLRRLRPWWRWVVTVGLIGWFMALTRFEPSVLRAGVMAMLAATAFFLGRPASPLRLLAWAVTGLVLVDPLLVWSVGFWLSIGATAGVCVLGPRLLVVLPGPLWLRAALAVTLGAQAGVAVPSLLVFHRLPVVSVPANLAAVPVAGMVMLLGLPCGLIASSMPHRVAGLLMAPSALGTRWVATVARVASTVEPGGGVSLALWVAGLGAVLWRVRAHRRGSREPPSDVPI